MRSNPRQSLLPLSALAVAIAVAGCQAYPAGLPTAQPGSAQAQTGDAVVTADLGPLLERLRNRRVLGLGFNEPAITQYRLRAKGPGMTESASTPVAAPKSPPPLVDGGNLKAYHVAGLPTSIALTLSSGVNRVFFLEGLDAQGHVLASTATLGSIAAGANVSLSFSAEQDAAARVLDRVLASDATTFPLVAPFRTADQTGLLQSFIARVVEQDPMASGFEVNPIAIDREYIVDRIRKEGTEFLGLTTMPPELSGAAWGNLHLTLTGSDGRTAYRDAGAQVTLFDPVSNTVAGSEADPLTGEFHFTDIPRGQWAVRITVPGVAEKWDTLTVGANTSARLRLFPAPTSVPANGVSAGARPAVAFNDADGTSLLVWDRPSGLGREIAGRFYDVAHQAVGAEFVIANDGATLSDPHVCYSAVRGRYFVTWNRTEVDGNELTHHAGLACEVTRGANNAATIGSLQTIVGDNTWGGDVQMAAIASPSGGYVVGSSAGFGLTFREYVFNSGGNLFSPSGHEWSPSVSSPAEPSLAYNATAGRYVMAWSQGYDGTDVCATTVSATDWSVATKTVEEGQATYTYENVLTASNDGEGNFAGGNQHHPALATGDTGSAQQLLTWEDNYDGNIHSVWIDAAQTTLGEAGVVASGDARSPSLAYLPGKGTLAARYLLTWQQGEVFNPGQLAYHTLSSGGATYAFARYLLADGHPDAAGAVKLTATMALRPVAAASVSKGDFVSFWSTSDDADGKLGLRVMP